MITCLPALPVCFAFRTAPKHKVQCRCRWVSVSSPPICCGELRACLGAAGPLGYAGYLSCEISELLHERRMGCCQRCPTGFVMHAHGDWNIECPQTPAASVRVLPAARRQAVLRLGVAEVAHALLRQVRAAEVAVAVPAPVAPDVIVALHLHTTRSLASEFMSFIAEGWHDRHTAPHARGGSHARQL